MTDTHGPGRVLYQFPISHYCEKSRWNLDVKGLPYAVRNLLPGEHVVRMRRLGARTLPTLVDGGVVAASSHAIGVHLDAAQPLPPLLPADPELRRRADELETYFDDEVGPAVRRFAYGHILPVPGALRRIFFNGYSPGVQRFAGVLAPLVARVLARSLRLDAAGIERSRVALLAGADRLEALIDGDPSRYLVGDALSLADLSAAALFAPIVAPPGSPYLPAEMPAPLARMRESFLARPAGAWVLARYARDRHAAPLGRRAEVRAAVRAGA